MWVVVTPGMDVYVYREGYVRTAAVAFDPNAGSAPSKGGCEGSPENSERFEETMDGISIGCIGSVTEQRRLAIAEIVDLSIDDLKEAWQVPLRW